VSLPGPLTLLKVDTTSAFQHLTSKPKEITVIPWGAKIPHGMLK
jgi:hypothetical protein